MLISILFCNFNSVLPFPLLYQFSLVLLSKWFHLWNILIISFVFQPRLTSSLVLSHSPKNTFSALPLLLQRWLIHYYFVLSHSTLGYIFICVLIIFSLCIVFICPCFSSSLSPFYLMIYLYSSLGKLLFLFVIQHSTLFLPAAAILEGFVRRTRACLSY